MNKNFMDIMYLIYGVRNIYFNNKYKLYNLLCDTENKLSSCYTFRYNN